MNDLLAVSTVGYELHIVSQKVDYSPTVESVDRYVTYR